MVLPVNDIYWVRTDSPALTLMRHALNIVLDRLAVPAHGFVDPIAKYPDILVQKDVSE
jgi:hypothetical protein